MAPIALDEGPLHAPRSPSTHVGPTPDYEGEADRGRLELGGDGLDRMAFGRDERRTLGDEIAAASSAYETALARRAGYRRLAEAIGS